MGANKRSGLLVTSLSVTICAALAIPEAGAEGARFNKKPRFLTGEILHTTYDGVTNDLLTGGLGKSGLAEAAPAFSDPENPTVAELRTRGLYSNYHGLVETTEGGGYGVFFGPNVTADGDATDSEGLVAGTEYIAYADDGSGRKNVTMTVQVPDHFDPARPCIIAGPSSGSRGNYGAIASAGEWGLTHGCAVAYTDKGTGFGAHNLQDNTVSLITGEREDADVAGKDSNFTANISDGERAAFNAETPHRFAIKHAHSEQHPERDWGNDTLRSIEFAFFVLNEQFGEPDRRGRVLPTFTPENTLVIAASVSNGGGSVIMAGEEDRRGLIDGVVASEPNVTPVFVPFGIAQGDSEPFFDHSRALYDYYTLINIYQGCANLDPVIASDAPLNLAPSPERCASLHEKGLLSSATLEEQATEAQRIINDYGFVPEQNILAPSHWFAFVHPAVAVTYANSYVRASVTDNLCGFSFGATDPTGTPVPLSAEAEAALFGPNAVPPTGGVNIINNDSLGGPLMDRLSISPSTGRADQNLDGALCLRTLFTGRDVVTGERVRGQAQRQHRQLVRSLRQIRFNGHLHGIPTVIVHGRADAVVPINHSSRPYFGLNRLVEGDNSGLRYYEVTNAQHLDAFNQFAGFKERYVPLHHYFNQALDLMYDHLTNGAPLPPSQVVKPVPRGLNPDDSVPLLGEDNLTPIAPTPDVDLLITFDDKEVRIPE